MSCSVKDGSIIVTGARRRRCAGLVPGLELAGADTCTVERYPLRCHINVKDVEDVAIVVSADTTNRNPMAPAVTIAVGSLAAWRQSGADMKRGQEIAS